MGKITSGKYIPELDGLRAVAILMVLVYHFRLPGTELYGTGVNLFFVISGFLISGILMDAKEAPNYFKNFYIRRILRIFPIYYIALAFVLLPVFQNERGSSDWVYYLLYSQNYAIGFRNWFAHFSDAFTHSWSLAVEEQFYLFWPLVIYKVGTRKLFYVIAGLFGLAVAARVYLTFAMPGNEALMLTSLPTELDSLMSGAFLAAVLRSGKVSGSRLGSAGLVAVLGSLGVIILLVLALVFQVLPGQWAWLAIRLGFYSLLAVLYGGLVAFTVFRQTLFSKLMNLGPARYVGKISYGLYLYHLPVYFLVDRYGGFLTASETLAAEIAGMLAKLGLTFLVAGLSWKWIETPILKLKDRYANRSEVVKDPAPLPEKAQP